jgi:adenylylsulfate kinase-like enzyme
MLKGRIYWFTGEASNSRELAKKLHTLLQSEKRNWRRDVFYLDSEELRTITNNKDYTDSGTINHIRHLQMVTQYLHTNGCDVVVSDVSPYKEVREEFKARIGLTNFSEFYVHNSKKPLDYVKYGKPTENFISVDTFRNNTELSFGSIVNYLIDNHKL